MTTFVILAAVMAAAAVALVAWPLYRDRQVEAGAAGDGKGRDAAPSRRAMTGTIAAIAVGLPLAAFVLYDQWSNWSWDPADMALAKGGGDHSLDTIAEQLERRLADDGGDVEGWLLLGRTKLVMGDLPGAVAAYAKANELSEGRNVEALVGYGEALSMQDASTLKGKAGELFDAALKIEPGSQKALWYGGVAALESGNVALARDRWAALSATNPPAEIKAILDTRIAELDQQLGRPAATPASAAAVPAAPAAAAPAVAPESATAPGRATVRITVAPALAGSVKPGTPLFVLARDAAAPGPPLAARRFVDPAFPLEVSFADSDSMIAGRSIGTAKDLVIVARYSSSGMPTPQSGDAFGEVHYDLKQGKPVELVIDQRVP